MRLLIFHVDSFTCTLTEKSRSPLVEEPAARSAHIDAGLLVLASVEAGDQHAPEDVMQGAADEITKLAGQLAAKAVMLLPFAHLFADPAPAEHAIQIIDGVASNLSAAGFAVQRPPFGWFHSWDLKAKGHPLSRVARTIHPASPANPRTRGD